MMILLIRHSYLMIGASARNVEKVIRLVLEKVAGIKIDRLP